jgi:hypothetical protein
VRKKLQETTREALTAVLPITLIVFLLSVFISPMPAGTLLLFLLGAVMLIIGMGFFTMGADMSMITMGEDIGIVMTKTKKLGLVGLISFFTGVVITIAEPDLQVLAELVPGIPNLALILTVAGGVGIFLLLAIFRILFRISLSKMLIACYIAAVALSFFSDARFVAVAFDSGGVTTGPITVPFILAMGLGVASIRADRESKQDSFGLVALCSIGPILAVLILGLFFAPPDGAYTLTEIPQIDTTRDATLEFAKNIPHYLKEVAGTGWPILAVLGVFQLFSRRYTAKRFMRVIIGLFYTFFGLLLFMTGVNVGFIPVGQSLGASIASSGLRWLLLPIGALVGYFIVAAEPAVLVLKRQIEEVSMGAIAAKSVQTYLSAGVAVSAAISMLRVLTGISIYWFLIPGFAISLALTFFVPKIFTGIAFDSGGVVTGPMTSTFLLPFAIGACQDPSRIMTDAFGLVAMVAMTPLIALQIMGFIYKGKMQPPAELLLEDEDVSDDDIIDLDDDVIIAFDDSAISDSGVEEPADFDVDEIIDLREMQK